MKTETPQETASKELSDGKLAEIEVREPIVIGWGRWVQLRSEERDALCQTVRAAWANEIRLATGLVNIYHVIKDEYCDSAIGLGMATSAVSSLIRERNEALSQCADLHRDIAALREQLAEAQFWKKQAEGWIAGVEEREAATCPEDTPFDDYIRTLQSRLAQVEKERNNLEVALRPFASLDVEAFSHLRDKPDDREVYRMNETVITVGDIRKARTLLANEEQP